MVSLKNLKIVFILVLSSILLNSCGGKLPGADARKYPDDPAKRVAKNIEEGRSFRAGNLMDLGKGGKSEVFEFASSNELWRASLDVLDFMPLTSANYSGGVIITDWYSEQGNANESIKITIRFLSNEIRSDAINVDVFYKKCASLNNCQINKQDGQLKKELTKQILSRAAVYQTQSKDKNFKPYNMPSPRDNTRE